MKKLKLGFTLTELITALAVVGVIAAITMPLITKAVQKNSSGAILGRAVAQIEQGNQNLIQQANLNIQDGSQIDVLELIAETDLKIEDGKDNKFIIDSFADIIPPYWGLEPEKVKTATIKTFAGDVDNTTEIADSTTALYNFSKFPASVAIYSKRKNETPSNNLSKDTKISIYIDTTGWNNAPNILGKDIFLFNLRNNGKLIPCKSGTNGLEKTAKVVKDGFKITYY